MVALFEVVLGGPLLYVFLLRGEEAWGLLFGNLTWMSRRCWQTFLFHLWTVNSELMCLSPPGSGLAVWPGNLTS